MPQLFSSLAQSLLLALLSSAVLASDGDRSYVYNACLSNCRASNCAREELQRVRLAHPLTRWATDSCEDRCRHQCVWQAVAAFEVDGLPTPKFHGRWPFARFLGLQEPASAIFSALNCICHVYMFAVFRNTVDPQSPMYRVWHLYSIVAIVTWFSSTVFHAKDVPFTEQLDYFSALMYLLTCLFCLACRITIERRGDHRATSLGLLAAVFVGFYARHVWYLTRVEFDYGYNMAVNLCVGGANCLGWLVWSLRRVRSYAYTRYCLLVVVLLNGLVLLEVFDFPPLLWVFDAHSLWHGGTILLAVPWYWFAIADCHHLLGQVNLARAKDT